MKFGAFIITFNRPAILKDTIRSIFQQTHPPDLILVVDNGDVEATRVVLRDFDPAKVLHHSLGDNLGPAAAEAYGLKWFCEQGYDWIYWVDDDNPPQTPDTLERLLNVTAQMSHHDDVGGVAAAGSAFDWTTGERTRLPDQALHGILDVDFFGGNGQLIFRREVVEAVGLPDPRLFIGHEDTEYCLRIRRAGYRLLVDGDLMREYRVMNGRLNLKPMRLPRLRKYQNIWRRYYGTRNYIFAMKNTFQRPDLARREAVKAFGRAITSWRRGPKYGATFSHLQLRGIVDGYLGRMGRTVLPKPKYGGNS